MEFILFTALAIHIVAMVSPGPDFVMAVKNSMSYGRKIGLLTAVGFGLGIAVHITYSLFGIALLISKSIILYNIIKYIGAAYLIYIGIKSLVSKSSALNITKSTKQKTKTKLGAIFDGFLTNVLNPKATLYFLSLFTVVLTPQTPQYVYTSLAIILPLITTLWFSIVAFGFTTNKVQQVFKKISTWVSKTFGIVLITLGLKVATD